MECRSLRLTDLIQDTIRHLCRYLDTHAMAAMRIASKPTSRMVRQAFLDRVCVSPVTIRELLAILPLLNRFALATETKQHVWPRVLYRKTADIWNLNRGGRYDTEMSEATLCEYIQRASVLEVDAPTFRMVLRRREHLNVHEEQSILRKVMISQASTRINYFVAGPVDALMSGDTSSLRDLKKCTPMRYPRPMRIDYNNYVENLRNLVEYVAWLTSNMELFKVLSEIKEAAPDEIITTAIIDARSNKMLGFLKLVVTQFRAYYLSM